MINYVITITERDEPEPVTYAALSVSPAAALEDAMKRHLGLRQSLLFVTDDTAVPDPVDLLSKGESVKGDIISPLKGRILRMPAYVTVLRDVTIQVQTKYDHSPLH